MYETTTIVRSDGKRIARKRSLDDDEPDGTFALNRFPFWKELFAGEETEGDLYGPISNHTTYSLADGFKTVPGDAELTACYKDTQRCGDAEGIPMRSFEEKETDEYEEEEERCVDTDEEWEETTETVEKKKETTGRTSSGIQTLDFVDTGPAARNTNAWTGIDVWTLWSIICKEVFVNAEDYENGNVERCLGYVSRIYEYAKKNPGVTIQDVCSILTIMNKKNLTNTMDRSLTAKSKRKKRIRINLIKAICDKKYIFLLFYFF